MSSARKSVLVASLGLMLLAATPARAEVWGYVDAKGRTHFADHQINHRYQLYFKGAGAVAEPERLRRSAASSLQTSFEISVGYKAVRHLIREAAIASGVDYELLKAVIYRVEFQCPRGESGGGGGTDAVDARNRPTLWCQATGCAVG
ncbi:MAG: DUF4124 domain-containing protein [Burkholderiaceae bacterium]